MTADPRPSTDRFVTLITGASSGLGAEMARQFAALGHDLALCARRTDRLESLRAQIVAAHPGVRVEIAALDVTDEAAVPEVFEQFARQFGHLDRVVVNAGLGKGAPLGTGRADANRQTVVTNLVGGLAQVEAALAIFRRQGGGHLVLISSISALRGMRGSLTAYAASKAGLAAVGEGVRAERVPGVDVSVIYPGYIRSEMNDRVTRPSPLMVDTEPGVRAIVAAVQKRRTTAYVPAWPWVPLAVALRALPLSVVRRLT